MARYIELALVLILGALAWPTVQGIVSPASAKADQMCGVYEQQPCFVALVACDSKDPDDCTKHYIGDWVLNPR